MSEGLNAEKQKQLIQTFPLPKIKPLETITCNKLQNTVHWHGRCFYILRAAIRAAALLAKQQNKNIYLWRQSHDQQFRPYFPYLVHPEHQGTGRGCRPGGPISAVGPCRRSGATGQPEIRPLRRGGLYEGNRPQI